MLISDQLLIAVQAQGNDRPSLSPLLSPWCWAGVRVKEHPPSPEQLFLGTSCSSLLGPWVLRRASGEDTNTGGGPTGSRGAGEQPEP